MFKSFIALAKLCPSVNGVEFQEMFTVKIVSLLVFALERSLLTGMTPKANNNKMHQTISSHTCFKAYIKLRERLCEFKSLGHFQTFQ